MCFGVRTAARDNFVLQKRVVKTDVIGTAIFTVTTPCFPHYNISLCPPKFQAKRCLHLSALLSHKFTYMSIRILAVTCLDERRHSSISFALTRKKAFAVHLWSSSFSGTGRAPRGRGPWLTLHVFCRTDYYVWARLDPSVQLLLEFPYFLLPGDSDRSSLFSLFVSTNFATIISFF